MKIIKLSLILFIILFWTGESRTEGFPVKDLPASGKSLTHFLPRGWAVDSQASGDLNGDGVSDIAAILFRGKPGSTLREAVDEEPRALIVLLGHDKGRFTLAGTNNRFLLPRGYGGAKEGVGIRVKKGCKFRPISNTNSDFSRTLIPVISER